MCLVHAANFLQHGGAPGGVAGHLEADVTSGRGGEDDLTVVIEHRGAALSQFTYIMKSFRMQRYE